MGTTYCLSSIRLLAHAELNVAIAIHAVMQAAYQQEADLLGVTDFPPLKRTAANIAGDTGRYYGAFADDHLAGVLHYKHGNIDSLVVHPRFQRLGLATRLLGQLLAETSGHSVKVSTAKLNVPATTLYTKFGFSLVSAERKSGIDLVNYELNSV